MGESQQVGESADGGGHLTPAGEPGEAWGTKEMQSLSRDSSAPLCLTEGAQEGWEGTGTLGESGRSRSFIWLSVILDFAGAN